MGQKNSKEEELKREAFTVSDPTFKSEYTPAFAVEAKKKATQKRKLLQQSQSQQIRKSSTAANTSSSINSNKIQSNASSNSTSTPSKKSINATKAQSTSTLLNEKTPISPPLTSTTTKKSTSKSTKPKSSKKKTTTSSTSSSNANNNNVEVDEVHNHEITMRNLDSVSTGDPVLDEIWTMLDAVQNGIEEERIHGDLLNDAMTQLEEELFELRLLTDADLKQHEIDEARSRRNMIDLDDGRTHEVFLVTDGLFSVNSHRIELFLEEKKISYGTTRLHPEASLRPDRRPKWLLEMYANGKNQLPLLRIGTGVDWKFVDGLKNIIEAIQSIDKQHPNVPILSEPDWKEQIRIDHQLGASFIQLLANRSVTLEPVLRARLTEQVRHFSDSIKTPYLLGEKVSWLDIVYYTWIEQFPALENFRRWEFPLSDFPKVLKWLNTMRERASVIACAFALSDLNEAMEFHLKEGPVEIAHLQREVLQKVSLYWANHLNDAASSLTSLRLKHIQTSMQSFFKAFSQYEQHHQDVAIEFPHLGFRDESERTEKLETLILQLSELTGADDSRTTNVLSLLRVELAGLHDDLLQEDHIILPHLRTLFFDDQVRIMQKAFDATRVDEYEASLGYAAEHLSHDSLTKFKHLLKISVGEQSYAKFEPLIVVKVSPKKKIPSRGNSRTTIDEQTTTPTKSTKGSKLEDSPVSTKKSPSRLNSRTSIDKVANSSENQASSKETTGETIEKKTTFEEKTTTTNEENGEDQNEGNDEEKPRAAARRVRPGSINSKTALKLNGEGKRVRPISVNSRTGRKLSQAAESEEPSISSQNGTKRKASLNQ